MATKKSASKSKSTKSSSKTRKLKTVNKTHLKPHHAKPFRKRHLGLSALGVVLIAVSSYVLGFGSGRVINNVTEDVQTSIPQTSGVSIVRSSRGFSFVFDKNVFEVSGTVLEEGEARSLSNADLGEEHEIATANLQPILGRVTSSESLTNMSVQVGAKTNAFKTQAKNIVNELERAEISANLNQPVDTSSSTVTEISSVEDTLGDRKVVKRVYEITQQLGGSLGSGTTYSVIWSGSIGDQPFSVAIAGLIGGSGIPQVYGAPLETLSFQSDIGVAFNPKIEQLANFGGFSQKAYAQEEGLDDKYLADLVSPSVVKIYLGFCGELTVVGQVVDTEYCSGGTGSGFVISDDGYIATNGHVISYEAEDYLVDVLLSSQGAFVNTMQILGFTDQEIFAISNSVPAISALIASIYDAPDTDFEFSNEQREIWVALGDQPADFENIDDYFSNSESSRLKKAEVIDLDYAAKDFYVTALEEDGGFTASDVAILKVDLDGAPALNLATSEPTQNEDITIVGFPGDAENSLVDQDKLAITVTNGAISSIRNAAGSDSKLYQSDADASRGNSGGPAINANGEVIGLLTYRFKNEESVDASKSYIRAVEDLIALGEDNSISLNQGSELYETWRTGLQLFSENRFSKANVEFEKIKEAYPAHRLVDNYIERADKAIADGLDVKDFPLALALIGLVGGLGVVGVGVFLIIRHNHHHKAHVAHQMNQTGQMPQNLAGYQLPQQQMPQQPMPPQQAQQPGAINPPNNDHNNNLPGA